MRNEIIYRGLRLSTSRCKYFQVKEGSIDSLVENESTSTLILTFSPGSSAKSLSVSLGIPLVGSGSLNMTSTSGSVKFTKTKITLNGLTLEKQTYDPHVVNMIIVRDSETRVIQTYDHTIFVISKDDYKNSEFIKYLFYSGQLLYLTPRGPKISNYKLRNFPKIIIGKEDIELTSENENYYSLRRRYNDYLIREIDYQDQFITELRRILDNYGVELVRLNKEQTLSTTSYVTYQFTQTPSTYSHPKRRDFDRNIISHKQPIEFALHTTDMVLYHDFKNKYSNVNLITNFVEFKATDKAGDRWTAAVKWSAITEDFNHNYQQDDNSNFAFQCQFRGELYYYEVLDTRYEFLDEIITSLEYEDINGGSATNETNEIR